MLALIKHVDALVWIDVLRHQPPADGLCQCVVDFLLFECDLLDDPCDEV